METRNKYKVITSSDIFGFEKVVAKHLKNGWTAIGGVSSTLQNNKLVYTQSLIR
ncbi:MAG: DUF1737 domain-containing protein [Sphingobacterium sp.]